MIHDIKKTTRDTRSRDTVSGDDFKLSLCHPSHSENIKYIRMLITKFAFATDVYR